MEQPLHKTLKDSRGDTYTKLEPPALKNSSVDNNGLCFSSRIVHRELLICLGKVQFGEDGALPQCGEQFLDHRDKSYCRGYPKTFCPQDYNPHCGSNGRTYTNKCNFCNAYIFDEPFIPRKKETIIHRYLQGWFSDKLFLEYCKEYSVPSEFCTLEYNPHCASNGKTYGNKCGFCNGYIKSGRKLRLRYLGKCVKFEDAED
ncbi:serine protease inhibitor Kazal-type 10-like [Thamnophis elegans]|uniref:serine protease inhibitor Kazal-type 10-like n=1 Tax=Thamnophis elegans TaxID=35005 RepID=UPI0013779F6C|nr:serine protease inhibitor Kazal-type 10-like [Thamnophis elegans]